MAEGLKDDDGIEDVLATLRVALDVEPSAGFVERVRRAATPRGTRARRPHWGLLAAAAVLAATAGFLALRLLRVDGGRLATVASVPSAPPVASPVPPPIASRAAATPPRAAPLVRRVAGPLVPRGEAERLARYVAFTRRRPFAGESLPFADPEVPLAQPAALVIRPLEVEPIVLEEGSLR